ncbi:MAG: hypothetical protein KC656_06260, partial [Myxococcales bacterium]|nr:hypothetical protein [Myxococcales bacterium]
MNRTRLVLLATLLAGASLTALAGGSDLLDALLQRPASATGTVVVPDHHLRRWDPVTLFHTSNRGTPGPEDHPETHVELIPDHPGAWTWLDGKTLQFRPAEPWPPMSVVTVRGKDVRTDLFTLSPPPMSTSPRDNSATSGPVDRIELRFSDPLDPDALARLTSIEVRPRPGLTDDGLVVLGPDDFEVKTLLRKDNKEPVTYALVLTEPIDRGASVRVNVGLSLDATTEEAVHTFSFTTPEPFRVDSLGCTGRRMPVTAQGTVYPAEQPLRCTSDRRVEIELNATPADIGPVVARNLVRFEPTVEGLDVTVSGSTLEVTGDFADDQLYRVSLHPTALLDTAGRALDMNGESAVHLVFPRKSPFVRWTAGQGLLERHGPLRVPLEGRGVGTIDLRIHKLDPFNGELWPFPDAPISVDESQRPPSPGEEPEALQPGARPNNSDLQRRLRALGSPGFSAIVPLPLTGATGRGGLDLAEPLAKLSGRERPGHYLVGVREVDGARERRWMRVQVTDLALSTVEDEDEVHFLVTSLATGRPVPGATVQLEGIDGSGKFAVRAKIRTGADGTARWKAPGSGDGDVRRLAVVSGDDVLVLDALRPPDAFEDGTWRDRRGDWLSWAFHDLSRRRPGTRDLGHLFPERPVYRPEEDVFLKGYARYQDRGRLTPMKGTGRIEIQGPGANWTLPVTLSALGSFHAVWSEKDLPTGTYSARFVHDKEGQVASTSFQVEAYRLPTFELDLGVKGDGPVPNDTAFDVTATASYYAGGDVANRPIRWSVTQFPLTWNPDGPEGFLYASDGRYSRTRRFDSTPALDRTDTTDAKGHARLTLDPGIEPDAQPRTYVIEATVTDADEQTVTATHRVDAVPAFVLGLKAPRYQERAGRLPIEAIAVGPDGKLLADREVTVRLVQRQWHSVLQASDFSDGVARYVTDVVDVPVSTQTIRTGASPTKLDLDLSGPGVYVVELEARDALGRVQAVTTDLFAGGKGDVSWAKPEAGVFEVTSRDPSWKPGQTAKLLLRSPFPEADALVVVETPTGNRYQNVHITGGNATLSVPVEEGWVPKIPVHVLLRRGRKADAGVLGGSDLGRPQTVGTTHWLQVDPVENTVEVALSHPERAMPGQTVPVTVELKDPDGKPLAGEVTLWLVDQAVLALGTEQALDPRPDFIRASPTRTKLRTSRNLALGRLPFHEMPGGDGEMEDAAEPEALLDQASVRKNFKSVPYWEPTLAVPSTGKLTVQVPLPDNLTVFKIRAKAVSGASRFGAGKSSLRVRLPVLLQPDLPRFVRPGDTLSVGALARVVEGDGGAGKAEIQATGLEVSGGTSQTFTWNAQEAVRVAWDVVVPTPATKADGTLERDEVVVTVGGRRDGDGAKDAVQIRLPLEDDRQRRTRRQVLELPVGRSADLEAVPEPARPGSLQRTLVLSDHPGIVKMAAGMDVFLARPGTSAGSRIDRTRAFLGLGETRKALGMVGDEQVAQAVRDQGLVVCSALSGNRNFEGRINSDVRANYLMSPPL